MEMKDHTGGVSGTSIRAAFTIASREQLPAASRLCHSYRQHHPDHRFFIVLTDIEGECDSGAADGVVETITLAQLALPNPDLFAIEPDLGILRSALAPFCLRYLFGATKVAALLHLGPRSMVYRPLSEAWDALDGHDVLLVPRRLACDRRQVAPKGGGEGIYQSGLFGVRRGPATSSLLAWWLERGYEMAAGNTGEAPLDLIPACVDAVRVLRDPSYGVRAENLDERPFARVDGHAQVHGRRLATFDFAGYDPGRPDRLSTQAGTQRLDAMPVVGMLCRDYALQLRQESGDAIPAPRPQLGNGIALVPAMSTVLRKCVRLGITAPSPLRDPDGFCTFLATPNPAVFGVEVAPLVTALLKRRPDVAAAFPGAATNKRDSGFGDWLSGGGAAEEQLQEWVLRFGSHLTESGTGLTGSDVRDAGGGSPGDPASGPVRGGIRGWLRRPPPPPSADDGLPTEAQAAESGFAKVLDAYFSSPDLLAMHPLPYSDEAIKRLADRMRELHAEFPRVQTTDLDAFVEVAAGRRQPLLLACLRYSPAIRGRIGGLPSALHLRRIQDFLVGQGAGGAVGHVTTALLSKDWIHPMLQFRAFCDGDPLVRHMFPDATHSPAEALACAYFVLDRHAYRTSHAEWDDWARLVLEGCRAPWRAGVNLSGYLRSTTGMGESARSMVRTLGAAGVETALAVVPSAFHDPGLPRQGLASLFGTSDPQFDVNLVVANADDLLRVRDWLPQDAWSGRRNVGYWVWETETAPARFAEATRGLEAVWTPSAYSAAAIAKVVDIPVEVVPHMPDFGALDAARPARGAFGLSAEALLFGYFFDAKSDLERKNPAALIEAFGRAFGHRRDVGLVLKVSSPARGSYAFESLKAAAAPLNVIWIEQPLTRAQSYDLMASLDVYVSLHRAEGFGLTLAEAMAIGKPVIATGYSGNMDFMDVRSAWLVDHAVVSTNCAHGPYPAGSRWSEPSVSHAIDLMRGAESRTAREALGAAARRHVHRVLSPDVTARRASEALDALRARNSPQARAAMEARRA